MSTTIRRGAGRARVLLTAATALLVLTGCGSLLDPNHVVDYPEPTYPEPVEDYEPTEDEINQSMSWDCYYDPTMNENWHDDVICRRGTEEFRPILLEGQFVTEADMIAAGDAYEVELNG